MGGGFRVRNCRPIPNITMIVIKIGGGKSINIENIASDLASLSEVGIVVHGGNYYLDEYGKKLGVEKKTLTSPTGLVSRYTDKEVIELMYLTYAGLANKKIVQVMQKAGINAVGLSGIDGKLVIGKKHPSLLAVENGKKKVIKDDLTGSVQSINKGFLKYLLSKDMIPVITPPVITTDGEVINVDGDKVAAKIATDLKAKLLLFLIEAPGLLTDFKNKDSVITKVNKANLEKLLPLISGRMKRKLLECIKLLDSGIEKIIIADGTIQLPITNALKGGGTHVHKS